MTKRPKIRARRPYEALGGPQTPDDPQTGVLPPSPPVPDAPDDPSVHARDGGSSTGDDHPEPDPEPTLGELNPNLGSGADRPAPDFLFSDAPFPGQEPDPSDREITTMPTNIADRQGPAPQREPPLLNQPASASPPVPRIPQRDTGHERHDHPHAAVPPKEGQPGSFTWKQRVLVNEAYQFNGRVQEAPPWVDKNWLGHDDAAKDATGSPIVLVIPGIGTCRRGDYIVQQSVLDDDNMWQDRIEIYKREDFERMFVRTSQ